MQRVALCCLVLLFSACDPEKDPFDLSVDPGPDISELDVEMPDLAIPDAAIPDAAIPDAAIPDAAIPDAAPPGAPIGANCRAHEDCESNRCFDFSNYDPFCGGTACAPACTEDQDCVDALRAAGVPNPEGARCYRQAGECDMVGTGLGAFFCQ